MTQQRLGITAGQASRGAATARSTCGQQQENIHCDSHETYVVLRVETRKVSLNPRVSVKVKSK